VSSERPLYHRFFGHYASVTLSDATTVRLTSLGRDFYSEEGGDRSFYVAPTILSHGILRRAIQELASHPASGRSCAPDLIGNDGHSCTMGRLMDVLRESSDLHQDYLRRHILWLM